jgi:hypothetical protein
MPPSWAALSYRVRLTPLCPTALPWYLLTPTCRYDMTGSQAHEAFVYNVARGRLDVYTFDTWNLHQCQCGYPQRGLDYCKEGWYRWSINAFAYLKNATRVQKGKVPKFDEPFIGVYPCVCLVCALCVPCVCLVCAMCVPCVCLVYAGACDNVCASSRKGVCIVARFGRLVRLSGQWHRGFESLHGVESFV